jgi:hypothetical protein
MFGFSSTSLFHSTKRFTQIQFPSSRNCSPKFGAVPTTATTPASNYSKSVHRPRNPRVLLRSPRRGLHCSASDLSIGPSNLCQSIISTSALAKVFFPGEKPPLLYLGFLCFPVRAGPSSPSPHLLRWQHPPSARPPPRRRSAQSVRSAHAPRPPPTRAPRVAAPAAAGSALSSPAQHPSPSSLFHGWEKEDGGRKKMTIL